MSAEGRIRAVLLDLDGTVADSHELIYCCLDETARELMGVEFPRRLWETHVGVPLADFFAMIGAGRAAAPSVDALIDDYRARQQRYEDRLRPFPDIEPVLVGLRQRDVRLAIVTTKLRAVARRHLGAIGLAHYFDAVVGFDDCVRAKPDAEPFRCALQALEVDAAAAIGIGDSPVDVHGARAAGLTAIGALWGTVDRVALLAARPHHAIETPGELLGLLE